MKKCPSCDREFEDALRFCQTDGTPLVDAAPPVDPYKTMVASPADIAAAIPSMPVIIEPEPVEEDVLQIPPVEMDPKKTMYASESEIRDAMAEVDGSREPVMDLSPPPTPAFLETDGKDSGFSKTTPPIPSPFGSTPAEIEQPVAPAFTAPEPEPPSFMQPEPPAPTFNPFNEPAPMEKAEFSPEPAAPEQSWQPEEMQNPQYQPGSGVAAAGQNKTLAIISLVSGILGLTICCGWFIPSLLGVILGFMARGKANQNPSEFGGGGLATAGLITGAIGLVGGVVMWILYVFYFAAIMASMPR